MPELSPIQRCRKNKWVKGTVIRGTDWEMGDPRYEYWRITGFGEFEVLGKRVNLKPLTTSGETIIPFDELHRWRSIKLKANDYEF